MNKLLPSTTIVLSQKNTPMPFLHDSDAFLCVVMILQRMNVVVTYIRDNESDAIQKIRKL